MDNERKIVDLNKPHLLGKHYPAACSVPTLTEQAALFSPKFLKECLRVFTKTYLPYMINPMLLRSQVKDNRALH